MFTSPVSSVDIPATDLLSYIFGSDVPCDDNKDIYIDPECPLQERVSRNAARQIVKKLCRGFKALGLRRGETVCLYSANSIYQPLISLGAVAAGGVWTGMNPGYSQSEMARHLTKSDAKFLLCSPDLLDRARQAAVSSGIGQQRIFCITPLSATIQPENSWTNLLTHGMEDWTILGEEDAKTTTACLYSTSGTSGPPKLAMITHYNLVAAEMLVNAIEPHPYEVRQMVLWPMFHLASLLWSHITPLRAGWTTYIPSKFEPESFMRHTHRFQITDVGMAPAMMINVLRVPKSMDKKRNLLSSLRFGMCGSAPVGPELQRQWRELLPAECPWNCAYGMTELTGIVTKTFYPSDDRTGSIGALIPNTEARLLDDEGADVEQPGRAGELLFRGPTVFKGYYQDEAATREAFRDGFLLSGDVASLDEKSQKWFILDRKKELIKVRGFQVAPAELESVLLSHPGVAEAAVIGVTTAEDIECPRAYVVRALGGKDTGEELIEYLSSTLSSYKRLTGGVVFIESLPRNGSGKVLKRELKKEASRIVSSRL